MAARANQNATITDEKLEELATELRRQYWREYYKKNKERILNYQKSWRRRNGDRVKAYQKKWRDSNKEHIKAYDKERWRKKALEKLSNSR